MPESETQITSPTGDSSNNPILSQILPLLTKTPLDPRPVVLMLCGISGAGKSTLSKSVTAALPFYHRLSIDQIIGAKHGLYDIDYSASKYDEYQIEADDIFRLSLERLLCDDKTDVVLDRSFYAKEDREAFAEVIERAGARKVLVYLKAEREVLWERICKRTRGVRDADSARPVDEGLLDFYLSGFEEPVGEGEVVVVVS